MPKRSVIISVVLDRVRGLGADAEDNHFRCTTALGMCSRFVNVIASDSAQLVCRRVSDADRASQSANAAHMVMAGWMREVV